MRICFIHPDLGIGGAEKLVIDAAVGLQDRGHDVTIYTSYCDPQHCFEEARNGTLKVRVAGDSLVPPNFYGRFSILCAILRQLHLTATILWTDIANYDHIFVDQLSACIPVFRLFVPQVKILFYCHFPDYLLAPRASLAKALYRIPFDLIESVTTGFADTIVVNSGFTKSVFATAFPRIKREPRVVYPCVDTSPKEHGVLEADGAGFLAQDGKQTILSINRFERKKNIGLVIRAYALLSSEEKERSRVIIAGGYDSRVGENTSYHAELMDLCASLGLKHVTCKTFISALAIPPETQVLFLLSIPSSWKDYLLSTASLLAYTPEREHFGIVPLEAMMAEIPVLAHASGGPLETVEEDKTGWLRREQPEEWMAVIRKALFDMSAEERKAMGVRGKERAIEGFSREKMAERLEMELLAPRKDDNMSSLGMVVAVVAGMAVLGMGVALAALRKQGFL